MMYVMYIPNLPMPDQPRMIRKQVYIEPAHDRELKARAAAEGITEAALIRAALSRHLFPEPIETSLEGEWLRQYRARAEELSQELQLGREFRFDRGSLYADRVERPR